MFFNSHLFGILKAIMCFQEMAEPLVHRTARTNDTSVFATKAMTRKQWLCKYQETLCKFDAYLFLLIYFLLSNIVKYYPYKVLNVIVLNWLYTIWKLEWMDFTVRYGSRRLVGMVYLVKLHNVNWWDILASNSTKV